MTRNVWTRALWGGVIGVVLEDVLLLLGRAGGWVKLNKLSSLSRLLASQSVSVTPGGQIMGFVVHLLGGAFGAVIFAAVVRALHSRHNTVAGIVFGLVVWLVWGSLGSLGGLGPSPWNQGTSETLFTLLGSLLYGTTLGWITSDEAIGRRLGENTG